MAAELSLIVDMVVILGAASAGGYLASSLRQPVLLGYLVGGIVVGPAGLGIISTGSEVQTLSEIGVALLLFVLGVEFSLTDLLKVRRIALGGGTLQVLLTTLLGASLAFGTGWVDSIPKAIFLGAALSLSSTAVVLKSLIERNEVQTAHGQAMLAILIIQDLGLGLMLAVLPALTEPPEKLWIALFVAGLKTLLFGIAAVAAGRWLIPPLMRHVARTGSQELFVLSVFALCLGVALLTALIGLGIEMGAFVAGLMISQIESSDHALDRVLPMRDVFATLFFASIGTLIDLGFLLQNALILLELVAMVMIGKAMIVTPIVSLFGYSFKTALTVALGLNQIGEFSFVLAGVAAELGLFSDRLYGLTVGTAAITLLLTPFMLKLAPSILQGLESLPWIGVWVRAIEVPRAMSVDPGISGHIVVAGYGRVGQTLVRLLVSQGYRVLVIDSNEATAQRLRNEGFPYLYGDAASELVLAKAQLPHARALAIALPDPLATRLVLKRALSLAPELDVTVRAHNDAEIDALYQIGAREVVQPEFEASLEMGSHMLISLGISFAQVQDVLQTYRLNRYRTLLPERPDYQVALDLAQALDGLDSKWYILESGSPLAGLTLGGADVWRLTGATIMEIRRIGETIRYPNPQTELHSDDRLLVVGNPQEHAAFQEVLAGRIQVITDSQERWLLVASTSTLIGQSLAQADLRRRYGVFVQAVQRQDGLLRFPPPDTVLHAGDRILASGKTNALANLQLLLNTNLKHQADPDHEISASTSGDLDP